MSLVDKEKARKTLLQLQKNLDYLLVIQKEVNPEAYFNLRSSVVIIRSVIEDLRFELSDVVF